MLSFVLVMFAAAATANVVHENTCPDLKPVQNFNLTAFEGTWYEISKYPYDGEKKGKCASIEYKLEGSVLKVKNYHVIDGVQLFTESTAKLASDANNAGKLHLTCKVGDVQKESTLYIVSTDYSTYAIAYKCKYDDKKKSHQDFAWVLSRGKKLEGSAKTAVDNYLKANSKELDSTKLKQTDLSETACKFSTSKLFTEPPKA